MATRIRWVGVAVALSLLITAALAGAAWAANTIQCPNDRSEYFTCVGTDKNVVMYGTNEADLMVDDKGADTLYGRGGNDELDGGVGPD